MGGLWHWLWCHDDGAGVEKELGRASSSTCYFVFRQMWIDCHFAPLVRTAYRSGGSHCLAISFKGLYTCIVAKILYIHGQVLTIHGSGTSADPHGTCSVKICAPVDGSRSARRRRSESRKWRLWIRRSPNCNSNGMPVHNIKAACLLQTNSVNGV